MKIIKIDDIKVVISRINNYKCNHQQGWENIPHACIKVRHNLGYAWFGIIVMGEGEITNRDLLLKEITEGLYSLCDVVEVLTDMGRLCITIDDIVTKKYRPALFGIGSDELLQLTLENNVRVIVYQEDKSPPKDSSFKGGFGIEVKLNGTLYNGIVHHRSIILANYVDSKEVKKRVLTAINDSFPDVFKVKDEDLKIACTLMPNQ